MPKSASDENVHLSIVRPLDQVMAYLNGSEDLNRIGLVLKHHNHSGSSELSFRVGHLKTVVISRRHDIKKIVSAAAKGGELHRLAEF
jgi:hypothetical protein